MLPGVVTVALTVLWSCAPVILPEQDVTLEDGSVPVHDGEKGVAAPAATEHRCAAARYLRLIGRSIDDIDTDSLPQPLRIYTRGSRITMDYRLERLNVVVGQDGRVVSVTCG